MKQITDMLQRITDGAMLVNENGNVILWNTAAERLLGFRSEDLIGRPCCDVLGRERCLQDWGTERRVIGMGRMLGFASRSDTAYPWS